MHTGNAQTCLSLYWLAQLDRFYVGFLVKSRGQERQRAGVHEDQYSLSLGMTGWWCGSIWETKAAIETYQDYHLGLFCSSWRPIKMVMTLGSFMKLGLPDYCKHHLKSFHCMTTSVIELVSRATWWGYWAAVALGVLATRKAQCLWRRVEQNGSIGAEHAPGICETASLAVSGDGKSMQ